MVQKAKFTVLMLLCGLMLGLALPSLAAQSVKSPVAQDGPYQIGVRITKLTDASRDNRLLQTTVWYPALVSKNGPRPYPPDTSGAPYPLIIYSHGYAGNSLEAIRIYIDHLVSQGFVVAALDHQDVTDLGFRPHANALIDRPLDVLFLLNQLADLKDDALVGMMDTDNVGMDRRPPASQATRLRNPADVDPLTECHVGDLRSDQATCAH